MGSYKVTKVHPLQPQGFTIVELLIVIVVIGILAAIVIVTYSQITQRAQTAQYISAAESWEKVLRTQFTLSGTLPTTSTDPVCLGKGASDFPATVGWLAGECIKFSGGATLSRSYSQAFTDGITSISPPNGSLPDISFSSGGVNVRARGISASVTAVGSGYLVFLNFFIPAGTNCGNATLTQSYGSYSACQLGVEIK